MVYERGLAQMTVHIPRDRDGKEHTDRAQRHEKICTGWILDRMDDGIHGCRETFFEEFVEMFQALMIDKNDSREHRMVITIHLYSIANSILSYRDIFERSDKTCLVCIQQNT